MTKMTLRNLIGVAAIASGCMFGPLAGHAQVASSPARVVLPVAGYVDGRTLKTFGQYVQDRFRGYHVGDDVEVADDAQVVPVMAIADGRVRYVGWVKGYGGVIVLDHRVDGRNVQSLYGHVSLASTKLKTGDQVAAGQFIADLGAAKSRETDGERKHLHFSLRAGRSLNFRGYSDTMLGVSSWLNPQDFFAAHGLDMATAPRRYDPGHGLGGAVVNLTFTVPADWGVEYVPQLRALNLFSLSGSGSARSRSRVMIFDVAAKPTVALRGFKTGAPESVTLGEAVAATRYSVTKKSATSTWLQPAWRARPHDVWVMAGDDAGHAYVLAVNPKLPVADRDSFLAGLSRPSAP